MDLLRSLPIGLYLEQPVSWLHRIDPRVKFGWLLTFLLSPIASNAYWRLGIVGLLILLTITAQIPWRVWRRQMGLVFVFSLLLLAVTLVAPDGLDVVHHSRLPVVEFPDLSSPDEPLPMATGYQYELFDFWIFHITRRSVELALRVGTLTFTLLYSTNLYLLTTAPEEITAGLEHLFQPLKRFHVPVTEIILTLTLALRFIPLVLEEIQNLIRAIRTRAIQWKKLGVRGSIQVWMSVAERLLENLLLRAGQIASAMQVRGFTSANEHQVRWYQFRLTVVDFLMLLGIVGFWGIRLTVGQL
jgi:energy-coupling factor transport system permease protein